MIRPGRGPHEKIPASRGNDCLMALTALPGCLLSRQWLRAAWRRYGVGFATASRGGLAGLSIGAEGYVDLTTGLFRVRVTV